MAEVTVGSSPREDALDRAAPPAVAPATRTAPVLVRVLAILWAVLVAASVVFFAVGSVRIGAGNWIGRTMDVREIWSRFVSYLVREGASSMMVAAVTAAAAISLISGAVLLWLAFGVKDAPAGPAPDDPSG